MIYTLPLSACLLLSITCTSTAQPRSIDRIVGQNSIGSSDAEKIHQYAMEWAEVLQSAEGDTVARAQQKLVDPLEPDVGMSPYARSLYCSALGEGFKPLFDESNENEMAAVNAIQVLSLLGTEQACDILIDLADVSTEHGAAVRLWASIGLGKSFQTGILPFRRISTSATLLANYIKMENKWYIIARQFDSLAALQDVANLDKRQQEELDELSMELQAQALVKLLGSIGGVSGADARVKSLSFVLPSWRLQLIEPSIDEDVRESAQQAVLYPLIEFIEHSISRELNGGEEDALWAVYGDAVNTAGLIVNRTLGIDSDKEMLLSELWLSHNQRAMQNRVDTWKRLSKN